MGSTRSCITVVNLNLRAAGAPQLFHPRPLDSLDNHLGDFFFKSSEGKTKISFSTIPGRPREELK